MAEDKVLIVEDDRVIAELLAYNLKEAGYSPQTFPDGQALLRLLQQETLLEPSLFILDVMLPGMDGYELCQKLRQNSRFELTPILMLTARGSEADKVKGLGSGADDYLTKPFGMRELLARVQAMVRRYAKTRSLVNPGESPAPAAWPETGDKTPSTGLLTCRDLVLDDVRHRVFKSGQEIEMTHREFELLKFLMTNRGIAFSRDDLLNHVWGFAYGGETRTVDVHIRQLRRKLDDDAASPAMIETVRGRGYRFSDQAG
ncbi:MAG: response regulator transcription factor [Eubacteriales bacterium]|nr:response regulator transcription factor [Eubacteriales bacterium]